MDIEKLARMGQFSLDLGTQGQVRFVSLTTKLLSESIRRMNEPDFDPKGWVRWLFSEMARWPSSETFQDDDPIDGETLKPDEMEAVSDDLLEIFAEKLIQKQAYLLKTHGERDLERAVGQSACDFLANAFLHHRTEEGKQRERLFQSVTKPLFAESTLDSIRRSIDASSHLQESIKTYAEIGSTLDSTLASRMAMPRPHELMLPPIPKNPIHETNEILEELTTQLQDMRPLIAQGAELIRSMNDTALRMQADYIENAAKTAKQAKLAIWIAATGLVVSSIFSYLSYADSKEADRKFEAQMTGFRAATERLASEQKEAISTLVKTVAAGRHSPPSIEAKK